MSTAAVASVGAIAEQRWGLITTAQAGEVGVSRMQLSRLRQAGVLERVMQGVYRMVGAPELEHEHLFATWLALGGARTATDNPPGLVAAGATAAELHKIGDLYPESREFIVPSRQATRLTGVRLRVRGLQPGQVTIVDQLPVLTVEATIADLVEQWTDLSLVADAIGDAIDQARLVSPRDLVAYLEPAAARRGYRDGVDLVDHLFAIAGAEPIGTYQ